MYVINHTAWNGGALVRIRFSISLTQRNILSLRNISPIEYICASIRVSVSYSPVTYHTFDRIVLHFGGLLSLSGLNTLVLCSKSSSRIIEGLKNYVRALVTTA